MQASGKFSITPVAAAVTAALYPGHAVMAQDTGADNERGLEEIVVTARKRTESVQDVPATIQAISQESLAAMGAKAMEDYARFVPSVNVVTYGPGSSTVVFRGAITGAGYIGQSTSSVYLDEISVTQTGAQPNIRAVDIARVEALSGPQGTLYGSDAQAGTMRILTNQPVMNSFEAIFDGEVRGGGEADASYRGSLVFNIPLLEDRLALRVVGFNDHDGGFIDNVPGHTADTHSIGGNTAPAGWGTLDNSLSVEENWNEADIYGGRVHLLWEMNDSWSTTLSYHHQTTNSGAGNYFDPFVGDLQVVRFHNEMREETFDMGSIRVDGDFEFAQLVAAVSYYDRKIVGLSDITTYAHYWAAVYCHDSYYMTGDPFLDEDTGLPTGYYANYYWANPATGYVLWYPRYCQGPTVDGDFFSSYDTRNRPSNDDKLTVELRLQSVGDTLDWLVGGYYEESKDSWAAEFATPTLGGDGLTNTFAQSAAAQYWEYYWGSPMDGSLSSWFSQSHTDWEQTAVFGEVSWHISDSWDLTVGARYFERSNTNFYLVNHPGAVNPNSATPFGEPDPADDVIRQQRLANNGLPFGREGAEDQFIPKISLSYAMSDNAMVYGLYTQGLRQGGVNRSRGVPFFPNSYASDIMDNYEIGYKSTFAGGSGRFNVTAYNMTWSDYQLNLVDPASQNCLDANGDEDVSIDIPGVCGQPWQAIIANAGEAHIDGVNIELDYAFSDNWLFGMNYEVMEAETDTQHDLNGDGVDNLVAGLRLPLVPSAKGSAWLEYSMPVDLFGGEEFFIRTQWSYTGDSVSVLEARSQVDEPNPQFFNPSYVIGDIRMGFIGEDWQVDVFVNNLTDERAIYTTQNGLFEWGAAQTAEGRPHHQTVFTNRPREVGVRFMKRWGD